MSEKNSHIAAAHIDEAPLEQRIQELREEIRHQFVDADKLAMRFTSHSLRVRRMMTHRTRTSSVRGDADSSRERPSEPI